MRVVTPTLFPKFETQRLEDHKAHLPIKHLQFDGQACNFNFSDNDGRLGREFIEAHHLIPYAQLGNGQMRKLIFEKDCAVLCTNYHRIIHRMESPSDIDGLKRLVLEKTKTTLDS